VKALAWAIGIVLSLGAIGYVAQELSPWPAALFYRVLMDRGGEALSRALARHVPGGVTTIADQRYGAEADSRLDVFHPAQGKGALPTIVWVHGGGFFSGSKGQVANYLKILAANGYTTVGVEYSLAPGAVYPGPLVQVNAALAYLVKDAARLRVDPHRIILAGDSAGAQIAAQLANIIAVPSYAKLVGIQPAIARRQLRAMLLYCGVYDLGLSRAEGGYAHFLRTVMWAYSGEKDPAKRTHTAELSVARHVTADFPPSFITAGNGDSLLPHSLKLAETLGAHHVPVDSLFFPEGRAPALPHEYQFNLDTEAGREALERSLKFLAARA
jgi:acetyl esterase/lipase